MRVSMLPGERARDPSESRQRAVREPLESRQAVQWLRVPMLPGWVGRWVRWQGGVLVGTVPGK